MKRALFALLFLVSFCACSVRVERAIGARFDAGAGHDGSGDADHLYFTALNLETLPDGVNVLVLPEDWSQRERQRDASGTLRLAEPIEPRWERSDAVDPQPLAHPFWDPDVSHPDPYSEVPLLVNVDGDWQSDLYQPWDEPTFLGVAEQRLEVGASAYLLRPIPGDHYRSHALYGAVGPPLEWVHLCDLHVDDSRNLASRATWSLVRWPLRSVEVLLGVSPYLGAMYLWGVWLT